MGRAWIPSRMLVAWGLALIVPGACNRYEVINPPCPEEIPEGHSSIGWRPIVPAQQGDSIPNGIGGVVLDMQSLKPIPAANVMLDSTNFRVNATAEGRFELGIIPSGHYTVVVRRIGFRPARASLVIGASRNLRLVALLDIDRVMLDGCGYTFIRQKKPWWKW